MRFEEAHFLGGPLDGEVRMIEYVSDHAVPHQEPVLVECEGASGQPWAGAIYLKRENYFKVWEGPADRPGRKHPRAILIYSEWE